MNIEYCTMKFCLIFVTLFTSLRARPQIREDSYPQKIQMKDLEQVCGDKLDYMENYPGQEWCWDDRFEFASNLMKDQFINILDEWMLYCACSNYALADDYGFGLWFVNHEDKEYMEDYVDYDDYINDINAAYNDYINSYDQFYLN